MFSRLPIVLVLASCATTPHGAAVLGPEPAILEVVNRAPAARSVAVDGQDVGVVAPGERRRFRGIRLGKRRVEAYQGSSERSVAMLDFASGQRAEWVVFPSDALTALPPAAPLGGLRLVSTSDKDVDVRLDEGPWRTLRALEAVVHPDLPPGQHTLRIRLPNTRYEQNRTFEVISNQESLERIAVILGRWVVQNSGGEPVKLFLDGARLAMSTLAPGQEMTIPLVLGVHALLARGEVLGREYSRSMDILPDVDNTWVIGATEGGGAAVLIENRTHSALSIRRGTGSESTLAPENADAGAESISPGGKLVLAPLPAGVLRITARAEGLTHAADVATVSGQTTVWVIRDGRGTLRVDNRLDEPVEVQLPGALPGDEANGGLDSPVLPIAEGATRIATDLPVGDRTIRARGLESGRVTTFTVAIRHDVPATLVLASLDAQVRVENTLDEAVLVRGNGQPLGEVPPRGQSTLTEAPVGDVAMVAIGRQTGTVLETTLRLVAGQTEAWVVRESAAQLVIDNRTSERLSLPPGLSASREDLLPGGVIHVEVGPGNRAIRVLGRTSNLIYTREQHFVADTESYWTVEPLQGAVVVLNHTNEAQRISLDGALVATVAPGKEHPLTVLAGDHRFVRTGESSLAAAELLLRVAPGATTPWEIRPTLSYVRIENRTAEPLRIELEDAPLTDLPAGATGAFGPWRPGPAALRAFGSRSGALYRVSLELHAGAVEPWIVVPARGVVRVNNKRHENIRVVVANETIARVPAGDELELDLPVGPTAIELIGVDSHAPFVFAVFVRADRAVAMEAPAGPRSLVVANQTTVALDLRVENHLLGRVEPGSERTLDLPNRGRATLFAADPNSNRTWQRRLNTHPDRVIRWEIRP